MTIERRSWTGLTSKQIAKEMTRASGEAWVGIGVDVESRSGALQVVLDAAKQDEVLVSLNGLVVIVKAVSPSSVTYADPNLGTDRFASIGAFKKAIRFAVLPQSAVGTLRQGNEELSRALERARA